MPPKVVITNPYRSGKEYTATIMVDDAEVGRIEKGLSSGYGGQRYAAIIDGRKISVELALRDVIADIREWAQQQADERDRTYLYDHATAWVLKHVREDHTLAEAYAGWYLDTNFGAWKRDRNNVLPHSEAWARYTAVKP